MKTTTAPGPIVNVGNGSPTPARCRICGQPVYPVVSTLVDGQPLANRLAMTLGRHLTCATESHVMIKRDRRLADLRHAFPAPRHDWRSCECDYCGEARHFASGEAEGGW